MSFLSDIAGSLIGADSSRHAANQQADAARASDATQRYFYDTTRADNAPLLAARNNALTGYQGLLANPGGITSDPGYQFGLTQGQNAIDSSAAAHGSLYSGATLKALQRYGQDYGSTKLDASLGRLSTLAGLGQPGAAAISSAGMNAANAISGNQQNLGNALAANSLNQGNMWGNALNSLGAYGQRNDWGNKVGNWFSGGGGGGGTFTGTTGLEGMSPDVLAEFYSDVRLKTNLQHVGMTERGHKVYTWDWKRGGRGIGVLAQEVQQTDPGAVKVGPDGFLMVDYNRV